MFKSYIFSKFVHYSHLSCSVISINILNAKPILTAQCINNGGSLGATDDVNESALWFNSLKRMLRVDEWSDGPSGDLK